MERRGFFVRVLGGLTSAASVKDESSKEVYRMNLDEDRTMPERFYSRSLWNTSSETLRVAVSGTVEILPNEKFKIGRTRIER